MSPNSAQYEEIAARILEALERGVAPWRKPWKGSEPCNVRTGRPYRGINSSWKTEVLVSGEWASNALCFATAEEAEMAGRELLSRWYVPSDYRAAPSADPINARMTAEYQRAEHIEPCAS